MRFSSTLILILILACGAFGQQSQGRATELKAFDATQNWQYPYNAPEEKKQRIRAAGNFESYPRPPLNVGDLFAQLGKPDVIESLSGPLRYDLGSVGNKNDYSVRCIWFVKKANSADDFYNAWIAAYVGKDWKSVTVMREWHLIEALGHDYGLASRGQSRGQGTGYAIGQGSGNGAGSGQGNGRGTGSGSGMGKRQLPPATSRTHAESYYLEAVWAGEDLHVFVRDEKMNYTGEAGGFFINQVPGLTFDLGVQQASMVLSTTGHTYSVGFVVGSSPFEIRVSKGVGNTAPTQAVAFLDVNLPKGTMAKLIISPQGIGPKLLYDADGDRIFESSLAPTVNLSGPNAKDITPPHVVITFVQQGSTAIVTLTATDDLSGVAKVRYSLDGTHFPFYSKPFTIDRSSNPVTVTAFADDNAGNRSGVYTKSFTFAK